MSEVSITNKQKLILKAIRKQEKPTVSSIYEVEEIEELMAEGTLRNHLAKLEKEYKLIESSRPGNEKIYELTPEGQNRMERILKRERQKKEGNQDGIAYGELIREGARFYEENTKEITEAGIGRSYVELDFKKLEKFNVDIADELLEDPDTVLTAFQEAVQEFSEITERKNIRVVNIPDIDTKDISNISSEDYGKFVSVEGVIQSVSDSKSARVSAVFECSQCGDRYEKKQETAGKLKSPYKCDCGSRKFEAIEENFETVRLVQIKENPDKRSRDTLTVILQGDLADDRDKNLDAIGSGIRVYGYVENYKKSKRADYFDHRLRANNIEIEEDKWEDPNLSEKEVEEFQEIADKEDTVDYLVKSVDHENIHGLELMREAFLLFYLGRTDDDNTHFLCIGEPSTGKSQLSIDMKKEFPRTMRTVADGASKVGLTGAVVKNEVTNEWHAEAGALPMADGGFHITDEIDKLPNEHYSAFNEALSDRSVSLSKANINTQLSADVSEFAIGNPTNRKFDPYEDKKDQNPIDSADLNSRFGVIFAVEQNKPGTAENAETEERKKIRKINDRYDKAESSIESEKDLLSTEKVAKYIAHAQDIDPALTQDAMDELEEMYIQLWSSQDENQTLIDTRVYQALRNLAVAYARLELEAEVSEEHVSMAKNFMGRCFRTLDFQLGVDDPSAMTRPRSTIDRVRKAVEDLSGKTDEEVEIEDVIDELDAPEDKIEEAIKMLKNEGELFDASPGKVKMI